MKGMAIGLLLVAVAAVAAEPDQKALKDMIAKLQTETKMVAVMSIDVPASQYKPDVDSNTIEIVFLSKKKDGPSRVSDDGKVIFLNNASNEEQSALIAQAFEIRARRRLADKLADK
jgi:hypothetical protein